jgi:hypothetical protein
MGLLNVSFRLYSYVYYCSSMSKRPHIEAEGMGYFLGLVLL